VRIDGMAISNGTIAIAEAPDQRLDQHAGRTAPPAARALDLLKAGHRHRHTGGRGGTHRRLDAAHHPGSEPNVRIGHVKQRPGRAAVCGDQLGVVRVGGSPLGLDQPSRDAGGKQRLATGDNPDRMHEVGELAPFEQEAAGAGVKRSEHIFVKLKGGQHQDAGAAERRILCDATRCLQSIQAQASGYPSPRHRGAARGPAEARPSPLRLRRRRRCRCGSPAKSGSRL